jgi:hypothetical protein
MTELEFIESNPSRYGAGNANILISSSLVDPGVDNTPVAPFRIDGVTVPFTDANGKSLEPSLIEATSIKFNFALEGQVTLPILAKRRKNRYYYLKTQQIVVNSLPATFDINGNYVEEDSNFIFVPFISDNFQNSDYNPRQGESQISKANSVRQVVDRSENQSTPTNFEALISQTATPAQLQDCSYTKAGIINGRYVGTSLNSGSIEGDDPAITLREFEGSIHSKLSDDTTITNLEDSSRKIVDIYFTPSISGSGASTTLTTFPEVDNFIYTDEGNRFIKVTDSKVYSVDKGNIVITNEFGKVTNIT